MKSTGVFTSDSISFKSKYLVLCQRQSLKKTYLPPKISAMTHKKFAAEQFFSFCNRNFFHIWSHRWNVLTYLENIAKVWSVYQNNSCFYSKPCPYRRSRKRPDRDNLRSYRRRLLAEGSTLRMLGSSSRTFNFTLYW